MKPKEEKISTDAPMTATDEAGLACLLTDAEIRKRKAAIRAEFKQGVKAVKELAHASADLSIDQAMRFGSALRWIIGETDDAKEGPRAFAEKREAEYKGE